MAGAYPGRGVETRDHSAAGRGAVAADSLDAGRVSAARASRLRVLPTGAEPKRRRVEAIFLACRFEGHMAA